MFSPIRVDSLATFLEAQAFQFAEIEGQPPNDDPPDPIPFSPNVYRWAA